MSETSKETTGRLVALAFAEAKQPVFKEMRSGAFVKFGDDNLYPNYLLNLFNQGTKHSAITGGKATYVAGKGWRIKDGKTDPVASAFIAKANRYEEPLDSITKKISTDLEVFGGYYLQVIWNYAGSRIAEIYHLDYMSMRSNADNTQFIYKSDWKDSREIGKTYPAFNPANKRGSQILYAKEYRPGLKTYSLPGYMGSLNYILAEIEVSKHVLGNSVNGFKPSKLITIVGPEPTDEEIKETTKDYRKATTGASGYSFMLSFVNSADRKHMVDDLGASDLTKEDFSKVDTMIQGNIYAGHKITTPALFGISTPGSLGQRTELRDGYEIFKNTYVNDKQQFIETEINRLAKYAGASVQLEIIPTEPIDFELDPATIAKAMTPDEIRAKAGLNPSVAVEKTPGQLLVESITKLSPLVANKVLESLTLNEIRSLGALSARPDGDVIPAPKAKDVQNGTAADALLAEQRSLAFAAVNNTLVHDNEELALELFGQYGCPKSDYRILKTRKVKFSDDADEFSEYQQLAFAEGRMSQLEASILDLISKDKRITPEALADVLKVKVDAVKNAIDSLVDSGAITSSTKDGAEVRELTKPLKDLQDGTKSVTRAFSVKYSYDGPEDSKNRPFCAKMMELGRLYSRSEIEAISVRLGYSVWDRRGGFYTDPITKETTPFCRHSWKSHVVIKNS